MQGVDGAYAPPAASSVRPGDPRGEERRWLEPPDDPPDGTLRSRSLLIRLWRFVLVWTTVATICWNAWGIRGERSAQALPMVRRLLTFPLVVLSMNNNFAVFAPRPSSTGARAPATRTSEP